MILLSRFILKGTSQAALVAAAMAVLGLIPVLGMFTVFISAAAVALVTLVQGYRPGLLVMVVAAVGAAVFAVLLFSQPWLALYFLLGVWLPVWLAAVVLRETTSLALSVLLVAGLSMLVLVVMYLLFPGFAEHWRAPLNLLVSQIAEQSMGQLSQAELQSAADIMIRLIPGLIASTLLGSTVLSLMLARWWQAVNFNPGGFATEFRAFNLGRSAIVTGLLILALSWWLKNDLLLGMSLIVLTLFLAQGTAVMHALVAKRQMSQAWLYLVYILMLFIPYILALLILAGLADAWLDFRRRVPAVTKP